MLPWLLEHGIIQYSSLSCLSQEQLLLVSVGSSVKWLNVRSANFSIGCFCKSLLNLKEGRWYLQEFFWRAILMHTQPLKVPTNTCSFLFTIGDINLRNAIKQLQMNCQNPEVVFFSTGNCAIIKPSEISAAAAQLIEKLIPQYLDQVIYFVYSILHSCIYWLIYSVFRIIMNIRYV